jgi:hypothetical protein
MRTSTLRGWRVVQDGEAAGMDRREARAYLWGRRFVDRLRTTLAGLSAGAAHLNSWCKAAALKTAADRYVVTPPDVSIVANGLVDVSVEPVVTSVLALP